MRARSPRGDRPITARLALLFLLATLLHPTSGSAELLGSLTLPTGWDHATPADLDVCLNPLFPPGQGEPACSSTYPVLFDALTLTQEDTGKTFVATALTDSGFGAAVQLLTNGVDDEVWVVVNQGGWGAPESFFSHLGSGKIDFAGATIEAIEIVVGEALEFTFTLRIVGSDPCFEGPDADGDGVVDSCDNCIFEPNPGQEDRGGVGLGSPGDGIGDVCQCGDVSGDGRVTLADAVLITRALLDPPTATLANEELCDVDGSTDCSVADAVIVSRAMLLPPTAAFRPVCGPAAP